MRTTRKRILQFSLALVIIAAVGTGSSSNAADKRGHAPPKEGVICDGLLNVFPGALPEQVQHLFLVNLPSYRRSLVDEAINDLGWAFGFELGVGDLWLWPLTLDETNSLFTRVKLSVFASSLTAAIENPPAGDASEQDYALFLKLSQAIWTKISESRGTSVEHELEAKNKQRLGFLADYGGPEDLSKLVSIFERPIQLIENPRQKTGPKALYFGFPESLLIQTILHDMGWIERDVNFAKVRIRPVFRFKDQIKTAIKKIVDREIKKAWTGERVFSPALLAEIKKHPELLSFIKAELKIILPLPASAI